MRRRLWSPEKTEMLLRLRAEGLNRSEIAARMGITESSVKARVEQLGLAKTMPAHKGWTINKRRAAQPQHRGPRLATVPARTPASPHVATSDFIKPPTPAQCMRGR